MESKEKEYKSLSQKDINDIVCHNIKEYRTNVQHEYSYFMRKYLQALMILDENKFSDLKNDPVSMSVIKSTNIDFDRSIIPDPLYKSKINELTSDVMNMHFSESRIGEFELSKDAFLREKILPIIDEQGQIVLKKLNIGDIENEIISFFSLVNNGTRKLITNDVHYNVWFNYIKSLLYYGNSALYIDTGFEYNHFSPINIELTDISWLQDEQNIINKVFCRKRYKLYNLENYFNNTEYNEILSCLNIKTENDKKDMHNKTIELLHIVVKNILSEDERPKYSIYGKDKNYLSLILCKSYKQTNNKEHNYELIKVDGYDYMPYIISRINRKSILSNYGYPFSLEAGFSANANSYLLNDTNDIAFKKGKPPLFENNSSVLGGNLNLNRRGINKANIEIMQNSNVPPVSILPTVEQDALQSIDYAFKMNSEVQDQVLIRNERSRAIAGLGNMSNLDLQYLEGRAIIKQSFISSVIESELKKPLINAMANYFVLNKLNFLKEQSEKEVNELYYSLSKMKDLPQEIEVFKKDIKSNFDDVVLLKFKEKLWKWLTNEDIDLLMSFDKLTEQNGDLIELKIAFFWDLLFDYDDEYTTGKGRFNIKSVKNMEFLFVPLREEVYQMQDMNLKLQALNNIMQIAQIDPESARSRINIDKLLSLASEMQILQKVVRTDLEAAEEKQIMQQQAMMQQQMQQEQQAAQMQQQPQ